VDPTRVSISAEPRRDRRRPFRYTVTGGVEVSDGSLCSSGGDVLVLFGRGRLVASQMVTLEADCGYQATVTVPARELNRRSGRINVRAKFRGNAQLNNAESQTIQVRFG
jgi:hypothetical protein